MLAVGLGNCCGKDTSDDDAVCPVGGKSSDPIPMLTSVRNVKITYVLDPSSIAGSAMADLTRVKNALLNLLGNDPKLSITIINGGTSASILMEPFQAQDDQLLELDNIMDTYNAGRINIGVYITNTFGPPIPSTTLGLAYRHGHWQAVQRTGAGVPVPRRTIILRDNYNDQVMMHELGHLLLDYMYDQTKSDPPANLDFGAGVNSIRSGSPCPWPRSKFDFFNYPYSAAEHVDPSTGNGWATTNLMFSEDIGNYELTQEQLRRIKWLLQDGMFSTK